MKTKTSLNPKLIFQFHKGAIGVCETKKEMLEVVKFQFHKGAIGVIGFIRVSQFARLFQFHKGAIGVSDTAATIKAALHFNSIKVRLESVGKTAFVMQRKRFLCLKTRKKIVEHQ